MLGKLDIHMHKNGIQPILNVHKSKLQIDKRLNCLTFRRKDREKTSWHWIGSDFLNLTPKVHGIKVKLHKGLSQTNKLKSLLYYFP